MRLIAAVIVVGGMMSGVARADNGCSKYSHGRDQINRYDDEAVFALAGCGDSLVTKTDGVYWVDRPTHKTSEIARVYFLTSCYDVGDGKEYDLFLTDRVLMCGLDSTGLNKAAFLAEADATALDAPHKATLKATFDRVAPMIERANRVVAERAKDPVYKQVLEAQRAAFKEWDGFYAANKTVIDAAFSVEEKWYTDGKVADGDCEPLRTGWQKWLSSQKITSAKQIPDAVKRDELGTITLRSLALCDAAAGVQPAAVVEADAVEGVFPFRGPRMHAIYAAMNALGKLIPESQMPVMKPLKVTDSAIEQIATCLRRDNFSADRASDLEQGKIDKVSASGADVAVTFKKESWMEPEFQCVDLPSRYWSQSDGRYKHDFSCKKVGQHKETSELQPAMFPAAYAKGLKPGQIATLRTGKRGDKRYAFPLESRSGTAVSDKGKQKFKKTGNDMLQTGGSLDVLYGVPTH